MSDGEFVVGSVPGSVDMLFRCNAAIDRHVWPMRGMKPVEIGTPCQCGRTFRKAAGSARLLRLPGEIPPQ